MSFKLGTEATDTTNETHCKHVSIRGILKSCTFHSPFPISDDENTFGIDIPNVKENDILFISSAAMPHFCFMIDQIPNRFILVTGDSNRHCPYQLFHSFDDYNRFINHPKLIRWYSQNAERMHHKLSHIPVGLNYHTLSQGNPYWCKTQMSPVIQDAAILRIKHMYGHFSERIIKCYANFQFDMEHSSESQNAFNNLPKDITVVQSIPLAQMDAFKAQSVYAFVISPQYIGIDYYRTWEILALGSIPVIKHTCIDPLFRDLPVLFVNDWKDITQELLDNTVETFKNTKFNYDKLTLKYWTNAIANAVDTSA